MYFSALFAAVLSLSTAVVAAPDFQDHVRPRYVRRQAMSNSTVAPSVSPSATSATTSDSPQPSAVGTFSLVQLLARGGSFACSNGHLVLGAAVSDVKVFSTGALTCPDGTTAYLVQNAVGEYYDVVFSASAPAVYYGSIFSINGNAFSVAVNDAPTTSLRKRAETGSFALSTNNELVVTDTENPGLQTRPIPIIAQAVDASSSSASSSVSASASVSASSDASTSASISASSSSADASTSSVSASSGSSTSASASSSSSSSASSSVISSPSSIISSSSASSNGTGINAPVSRTASTSDVSSSSNSASTVTSGTTTTTASTSSTTSATTITITGSGAVAPGQNSLSTSAPTSVMTTPQPAQVTQYVTTIINQQVIVFVQVFTIIIEPFIPLQTFTSVVTTTVTPVSSPGLPAPTPITTTLTQVVTITVGPSGTGIVGGTGIVVPIVSPTAPSTPTTITTTIVQPTVIIAPISGPASTVTFADGQVVTIQPGAAATTIYVTLTRTVTQAPLPTYTSTVYVTVGGPATNNNGASPTAAPVPIGNSVCTRTYTVQSGDICYTILDRVGGISLQQLYALNPAINSGCTNLQPGQVLCVAASSPAPAPITTTYTTVYSTAVVLVQPVINVYVVNVYAIVDLVGSTSISTQFSTQTVFQTQTVTSTLTATVTTIVIPSASASASASPSGNGAVQPGQNSIATSSTATPVNPSSTVIASSSSSAGPIASILPSNGTVSVNGTTNATLARRHLDYHVKRNRRVLIH